jgi:leader peptidase (prepilin peptidase) / N-methyltransferase
MPVPPRGFLVVFVFAVGLCVGSFLNVVIARVPKGKSIVSPASACPRCGAPIRWYDNIPVVSWIALRGKCRRCGLPISPRYPIVELLTAVLVVAVVHRFGLAWTAAGYAAFACALVALTFIDLDTWLLPHEITWPLLVVGIASPLWNPGLRPLDSAIGAAAGFASFAAIALFGEKVLHRETMGWGDVWLLAGIGAWLGWRELLPVVLLAALQGSIVGIVAIRMKRGDGNRATGPHVESPGASPSPTMTQPGCAQSPAADVDDWVPPPHAVPFGPFLALGALEQLLLGGILERAYFDLLVRLWR